MHGSEASGSGAVAEAVERMITGPGTAVQALEQQTYLPGASAEVAEVLSFLQAHEATRGRRPSPRYFLAGPDEGDHVEIPETVYRILGLLETFDDDASLDVDPDRVAEDLRRIRAELAARRRAQATR